MEWEATPSMNIRETYDDHALRPDQRSGDLITTISPEISSYARSPREEITIQYRISFVRYHRYQELSTSPDHQLTLTYQSEWTARLKTSLQETLTVAADPTRLNALGKPAPVVEILIPKTEVLRNRVEYTIIYETASDANLHVGLFRTDTRYKNPELADSIVHGVSLLQMKQLSSSSSTNLAYTFSYVSADQVKANEIHSATAGYEISPYLGISATVNGGGSYTTEDHRIRQIYGLTASKTSGLSAISFSAQRNVGAAEGVFVSSVVSTIFSLQASWEFTEALRGNIQETYNKNYSTTGGRRVTLTTTTAGLQYQLATHWRSSLEYQYVRQRTQPEAIGNVKSNRITVALIWEGTPWR